MKNPDNIQFNYLYRDAGNYKIFGTEVFSNPENLSLKEIDQKIRSLLIDGEFFEPSKWKVQSLRPADWDDEDDHGWNEFESVQPTSGAATVKISVRELLRVVSGGH